VSPDQVGPRCPGETGRDTVMMLPGVGNIHRMSVDGCSSFDTFVSKNNGLEPRSGPS